MSTPTTFRAHGQDWYPHTPGDPMPCDGGDKIIPLLREGRGSSEPSAAQEWWWGSDPSEACLEIVGWRYATPPQEKDELARLREENASMRTAIKDGHAALEKVYLAYCSTTADVEDCGIDNIARDAIATLSPFTESK